MQTLTTQSTSSKTVDCEPIELRVSDTVRLVFVPTLIDNTENPRSSVKGSFVYQKKGKHEEWLDTNSESLKAIKSGEAFKLTLHSDELTRLGDGLREIYKLKKEQGLPQGKQTFVKLEASLARFLNLSKEELKLFFDTHPADAVNTLVKIVEWLSLDNNSSHAIEGFASGEASELPKLSAILGIASLKAVIKEWEENTSNSNEEYWQRLFSRHSAILSQVFSYPVVIIQEKAYLGGKQITNKGGKEIDFLLSTTLTNSLLLVEIKTPQVSLLGAEYRAGVHPLSVELNGAVAQAINYRHTLMKSYSALFQDTTEKPLIAEPRCVVIAGSIKGQLNTHDAKCNFELLRDRLNGVTLITFDELLARVKSLVTLLEVR